MLPRYTTCMARKLRIAAAVFTGAMTLALCLLWMRSYSVVTNIQAYLTPNRTFQCTLKPGGLYFRSYRLEPPIADEWLSIVQNIPKQDRRFARWSGAAPGQSAPPNFQLERRPFGLPGEIVIRFPFWFAAFISGGLVALTCNDVRRFSLRTMLLATTLVAVVLGVGVRLSQ